MKELEELSIEIWNKLPRLIYEDEFELFDESNGYRQAEKLLIPEPPMLNDILEYLNNLGLEVQIGFHEKGLFIAQLADENGDLESIQFWDLSKPYLKDQSPELIKFLHGLIKK